jgi:hypothetical protein
MKKLYKRLSKNVITFQTGDDNRAVVLAKLGMSNKAIRARTKLTSNQITYRLHKAKEVEENAGGLPGRVPQWNLAAGPAIN